jgi:hypothetical protein
LRKILRALVRDDDDASTQIIVTLESQLGVTAAGPAA